jgi:hypothetical protein
MGFMQADHNQKEISSFPPGPPRVEMTEEVQRQLEAAALDYLVSIAVKVTKESKLEEKIARKPVDQLRVKFPCEAYIMAKVKGQAMRASVAFALGKKTAEFRTQLLERLGYVPPGTYVRFTWEFERNAMGKTLDKVGQVEMFFRWGG